MSLHLLLISSTFTTVYRKSVYDMSRVVTTQLASRRGRCSQPSTSGSNGPTRRPERNPACRTTPYLPLHRALYLPLPSRASSHDQAGVGVPDTVQTENPALKKQLLDQQAKQFRQAVVLEGKDEEQQYVCVVAAPIRDMR